MLLSDLNPLNVRYLFYLVSINETTFENVDDVPNYTEMVSVWFTVLVLAEFFLLRDEKGAFALNDTVTSMYAGLLSLLLRFGGRYLSIHIYMWAHPRIRIIDLDPLSPWTWILCFLLTDLCYYLGHRAVHEAGVFWSFHQMHHSSEYYNLSTALRQGCIQDFGMGFFDCLQAPLIPPAIFVVHKYLNVLYQFWLHTELVPELGVLEYVLNTPSAHRVHHGRNPYCIDKNYGGTLIIWDRLFGTYEPEKKEEKVVYGLVTNVRSFDQLWLQAFEFKALGWDKALMRDENGKPVFGEDSQGFWGRLKIALWPPGYFPGIRTKFFFLWRCMFDPTEGIPEIEKEVVKYNPEISWNLAAYVLVNAAYELNWGIEFSRTRADLPWFDFFVQLGLLIAQMQSVAYFFDKKSYAKAFELGRIVCFTLYFWQSSYSISNAIFGASLLPAVLALL